MELQSYILKTKISPDIGLLLTGVLIPKLLNNPFASCSFTTTYGTF